jgi:predicted nucleotidyltransferase component of viral defense system
MAYSIETVIAEKFHAMIQHDLFNSRMKDFYDVFILLKNNEINDESLQEAIFQTFRQRDTVFVKNHPLFLEAFYEDLYRQTMWKAFLRKMKIPGDFEFPLTVKTILERLQPIYNRLINI